VVTIVRETLQLATKTVADAMTPLHRVRMLPHDTAGCSCRTVQQRSAHHIAGHHL